MVPDVFSLVFRCLEDAYGPQGWWPGRGPLEVLVGAILTQRTAWRNAERAVRRLHVGGLLSIPALRVAPEAELAEAIRPSGCYRGKTRALKAFVAAVDVRADGDLSAFLDTPTEELRRRLLAIRGIGPETADAILLYAAGRPVFVVDAYTRRLFERLGELDGTESYGAVRGLFMESLPPDVEVYGEYHALVVRHGKEHCRSVPVCDGCPLASICRRGAREAAA